MSALGQFGSAIGQGYLQGAQYKNEQDRMRNQLLLQERDVATREEALARQKTLDDREFDWNQYKYYQDLLNNPEWRRNARPGELQKVEASVAGVKARRPEWFAGQAPTTPATGGQPQLAMDQASGSASLAEGMRPMFLQQGDQERAAATAPPQPEVAQGISPSAMPITDEQASSLMRETDPNFNIAQNERQAAMQPRPQPAPAAAPQAPPAKPQATPEQMPPEKVAVLAEEQAAARYGAMSKDPQYSDVERERFAELASNHSIRALSLRQAAQGIREGDIKLRHLEPGLNLSEESQREDIRGKKYDTDVYKPGMLSIEQQRVGLERLKAKQKTGGMTTGEWVQMLSLQHQINEDARKAKESERQFEYNKGKDVAEFAYKTGEGERTAETDVRRGFLNILGKSVMTVDPITHVPVMMKGGIEAYRRGVQQLIGQGANPTVDDLNPGFDPEVWSAVNQPGFNLNAALGAAQADGNQQAVAQIKSAYDFVRRSTSSSATSSTGRSIPTRNKQGRKEYRRVYSPTDRDYPQSVRAR